MTPSASSRSGIRATVRHSRPIVGLLLSLVAACHHFQGAPPTPDITTVKASARGLYRVAVRPASGSIPLNRMHRWTFHLETADGQPVDRATITVDGGMPQHGHGLPTKPRVTNDLGNGDHLVEGMKFSMTGWWVVKFAISSTAGVDSVTFNLSLTEGGAL
jgi:hypothetical protein